MQLKLILCLALAFLCLSVQSQNNANKKKSGAGIEKALDDGSYKNSLSQIKFRMHPLLTYYVGLNYEHKLSRKVGLEGGFYTRVSRKVGRDEMYTYGNYPFNELSYKSIKGGMGLTAQVKFYKSKFLNNNAYWSLRFSNFFYKSQFVALNLMQPKQDQTVRTDAKSYAICNGRNFILYKRFTLGYELAFGYKSVKYRNLVYLEEDFSPGGNPQTLTKNFTVPSLIYQFDVFLGFLL